MRDAGDSSAGDSAKFEITDAKLYFPIATLSTKDSSKFVKTISTFKNKSKFSKTIKRRI